MYNNEDYAKKIAQLNSRARALEQQWCAQEPKKRESLLEKFPSPVRPYQRLWANSPPADTVIPDYPPCPRCSSLQFGNEKVLDGVRHNGDGYGARYDICSVCGWTVWWFYDEA